MGVLIRIGTYSISIYIEGTNFFDTLIADVQVFTFDADMEAA